jgi:hypothetical protein
LSKLHLNDVTLVELAEAVVKTMTKVSLRKKDRKPIAASFEKSK